VLHDYALYKSTFTLLYFNRDHSSKLQFLRKSRFCILETDKQTNRLTDEQMDRPIT